ncbi:MAG: hypothetical protein FJ288_19960 [Planctomycetes bacterium]|nr:hypothetical protein [Planctomycetota bacterium]
MKHCGERPDRRQSVVAWAVLGCRALALQLILYQTAVVATRDPAAAPIGDLIGSAAVSLGLAAGFIVASAYLRRGQLQWLAILLLVYMGIQYLGGILVFWILGFRYYASTIVIFFQVLMAITALATSALILRERWSMYQP